MNEAAPANMTGAVLRWRRTSRALARSRPVSLTVACLLTVMAEGAAPSREWRMSKYDLSPSGDCYFGFYVGQGYDRAGQWHGSLIPHFEK